MLKKIIVLIMLCSFTLFILSGCGSEEVVFTGKEVVSEEFEDQGDTNIIDVGGVEGEETADDKDYVTKDESVKAEGTCDEDTGDRVVEEVAIEEQELVVHICGAVVMPGVYTLPQGSRVWDGVTVAGGFRDDASRDYINQAMELADGVQVIIPTEEEVNALEQGIDGEFVDGYGVATSRETLYGVIENSDVVSENQEFATNQVNINTADVALLSTLNGVGEATANRIIAYREEHGNFQKITDIMKVSGIKEASFAKIENDITVG